MSNMGTRTLPSRKKAGDVPGNSMRSERSTFTKSVQKSFSRTKERMRKTLKKTDFTQDDYIRMCEENFAKQQTNAIKLQREFKRYIATVRDMSAASQSLHQTIQEIYEDNWVGRDIYADSLVKMNQCWLIYLNLLSSEIQKPLDEYIQKFPELKIKIDRRHRKVMDYDVAKRKYEHVRSAKRSNDDPKVAKAAKEFEDVCQVYKNTASELYRELPDFHDSRMEVYHNNWGSLFFANEQLFSQLSDISVSFSNAVRILHETSAEGHYNSPRMEFTLEGGSASGFFPYDKQRFSSMQSLSSGFGLADGGDFHNPFPLQSGDNDIVNEMDEAEGARYAADGRLESGDFQEVNTSGGKLQLPGGNGRGGGSLLAGLGGHRLHSSTMELSTNLRNNSSSGRMPEYRQLSGSRTNSVDGGDGNGLQIRGPADSSPASSTKARMLRMLANEKAASTASGPTHRPNKRYSEPPAANVYDSPYNTNLHLSASKRSTGSNNTDRIAGPLNGGVSSQPPGSHNGGSIRSRSSSSISGGAGSRPGGSGSTGGGSGGSTVHRTPSNGYLHAGARPVLSNGGGVITSVIQENGGSRLGGSRLEAIAQSPAIHRSLPSDRGNTVVLKKLTVKYTYSSQDPDELSLTKGEIIHVIPFENEELQEDGWLYGVRVSDGVKGLFPENHTTLLQETS